MQGSDGCLGRLSAAELHEGAPFAGSVRAPDVKIKFIKKMLSKLISSLDGIPEYCALLNGSEGRQKLPHVLLELTLAEHSDKQLAVIPQPALHLHWLARGGHQLVHLEQKRKYCQA